MMAGVAKLEIMFVVYLLSLQLTSALYLLLSDSTDVIVLNDDTGVKLGKLNAPGTSQVYAVDFHSDTFDVYFSRLPSSINQWISGIWKHDDDSSTSSLRMAAGSVPGLAVDWVHNNLYYIDETAHTLNVLSLDTGFTRVLYTGKKTDTPRAVRVDPRDDQRYVYWTDWGENPYIKRCGLDGKNCENLIDENLTWPNSLTIEYTKNHLYWLESYNPARLYRSNLDGSDTTMMMGLGGNTRGVEAFNSTTVYVTDQHAATVMRLECHSTHCAVSKTFGHLTTPTDVRVLDASRQPPGTNVCSGLHCPLCLPAVSGTATHTYTCYNERAVLKLKCANRKDYCANGGVCEEVSPRIRCMCVDPYVGPRCMQHKDGYTLPESTSATPTSNNTTMDTLNYIKQNND